MDKRLFATRVAFVLFFLLFVNTARAQCSNFVYTGPEGYLFRPFQVVFLTTEDFTINDVYLSLWKFDPINEKHLTEEYVQYFTDNTTEGTVEFTWHESGKFKVRMIRASSGLILAEATNNITISEYIPEQVSIWSLIFKYSMLIPIVVLVSLSGLFSGLNLGLLGLDKVGLQIVIDAGSKRHQRYAKAIYPLRKNGNFLLCTLLLGNVMVNAALSILSADLFTGWIGFIASSALIVVFGEIIPQSICARHGLAIGYYTRFLVYLFMILMFPLAWPISLILDRVLGHEIGTIYSRTELKRLIYAHAMEEYGDLTKAETKMLTGAIDLSTRVAEQVMTNIDDIFMLEIDSILNMELMTTILQKGHSRIPIFEKERTNIVGMLFVKDMALLNPEAALSIRSIMSYYGRPIHTTYTDVTLFDLLTQFKTGNYHFAFVQEVVDDGEGDPYYVTKGVCTLEDVIEALIQENIEDEYDEYVSREDTQLIGQDDVDYERLKKDMKKLGAHQLTPQQHASIFTFLNQNVKIFNRINQQVFTNLLTVVANVVEVSTGDIIYLRGTPSKKFALILHGKVEIKSGSEGFVSEGGPFTYLGVGALTEKKYVPDFMCKALSSAQYLEITHDMYSNALKDSKYKNFMRKLTKDVVIKDTHPKYVFKPWIAHIFLTLMIFIFISFSEQTLVHVDGDKLGMEMWERRGSIGSSILSAKSVKSVKSML